MFNIPNHTIDTSKFSNLLHDKVVNELEERFAEYVGAKYACATNSATSALFLALLGEDTTVTLPSMIPPVVANAVLTSGNKLKFTDNTQWMGYEYTLHRFPTYKIIDSAQQLRKNQYRCMIGYPLPNVMIFSFYPTKPLGGIDGGMMVTDDQTKYEWFKEATNNGTSANTNSWDREIIFPGYKMYMNSIQARIILNNFNTFEDKIEKLYNLIGTYNKELGYGNSSTHLYRINVDNNKKFLNYMHEEGIRCGIHYRALSTDPTYVNKYNSNCPLSNTEQYTTVSLPMNETLTKEQIKYIIDTVKQYKLLTK